ncbi:SLC13 family permease [Luteolibacter marinus]|uniref:SLC13 family permease n=1 Tax=Luteolibacter marinus TaxID=2776705 RepID=UPI0018688C99|nr:DASS family sodium-coupled anion symporter [Luteolibacter marinus]
MNLDTRAEAGRAMGRFDRRAWRAVAKTLACVLLALTVVFGPGLIGWQTFDGLSPAGRASLGIMVLAAALWVSEAMPAFAVALLVMGLQIAVLGRPGGVWAEAGDTKAWTVFVAEWASPTMWLFLGGFVLAHACSKTGLDRWMASALLGRLAGRPAALLAGVMGLTFVFSMFTSNTATAAMMMAVLSPLTLALPKGSRLARGLILSVAIAANLGGIGTIIGTPPNAIAVERFPEGHRVDFFGWMLLALPPALLLAAAAYAFIWHHWVKGEEGLAGGLAPGGRETEDDGKKRWHRWIVMAVFAVTVSLWLGESLFKIPSPVVSFVPIVVLAVTGVIGNRDIRELPWDVLILLAGGLSLGTGVQKSGLAEWLAAQVPGSLSPVGMAVAFCMTGVVLSNLMSNTAAAALLIPLGSGIVGPEDAPLLIFGVAMGCSASMALPIATPPNAIAYATGRVTARDFLVPGIIAGIGILLVFPWFKLVGP